MTLTTHEKDFAIYRNTDSRGKNSSNAKNINNREQGNIGGSDTSEAISDNLYDRLKKAKD